MYPNDPAKDLTWWISGSIMCFFIVAGLVEGYTGLFLSSYFPLSLLHYAASAKAISTFVKFAF
jgi:hypothetical protein